MRMFTTLVKWYYGFTNKSLAESGSKTDHNYNDVSPDAAGYPASAAAGT